MLLSYKWLSKYLDLSALSVGALADILTDLGHEVESISDFPALSPGILVGSIVEAKRHPEADRLQVCMVHIGTQQDLQIVCGAANAREGLKVAVATVGTQLSSELKIKPGKLRGQASNGMLCSGKELGLSEDDSGLLELLAEHECGQLLGSYFDIEDSVLDVSLTPNRSDCLSYLGIARDLSAKLGLPLLLPETGDHSKGIEASNPLTVKIAADAGSARFTAMCIEGVQVVASPFWLQRCLRAAGMRSINLIVDVTNFVMLELGQPLHAYDAEYLDSQTLSVRSACLNEVIETLDGSSRELAPGDLLICDAGKKLAIAGIMGGAHSEVSDKTQSIVLEAAHFDHVQVRRTSKRLGLHTEASHRFERGIDLNGIDLASKRAAHLIQTCLAEQGLGEGFKVTQFVDIYPKPRPLARIAVRLPRVRAILGLVTIGLERCVAHLKGLGFALIDQTPERMLFEVPSHRHDVEREIDLIEEIARIEGFDKIPYELPKMSAQESQEQPMLEFFEKSKIVFAQNGLTEVITFPFCSHRDYQDFSIDEGHLFWPSVKLANPLNEDQCYLQSSLLPSLVKAAKHNRNQGIKGCKLFEFGRAFFAKDKTQLDQQLDVNSSSSQLCASWTRPGAYLSAKALSEHHRPIERSLFSGLCDSPFLKAEWNSCEEEGDFFKVKALIESYLSKFGVLDLQWKPIQADVLPFLHPSCSAEISCAGNILGFAGELHPRTALKLGFAMAPILVFELDAEATFLASQKQAAVDARVRKFPCVSRDFAFLVDQDLTFSRLEQAVLEYPKKKNFRSINLFDVYQGEKLPEKKKSMAATFVYESLEKTLTDKDVDKESKGLLAWLKSEVGADQR